MRPAICQRVAMPQVIDGEAAATRKMATTGAGLQRAPPAASDATIGGGQEQQPGDARRAHRL